MRTLETLLDEAVKKCTGAAELARRIGLHRSEISELKAGRRAFSPATVALLCDVLELEGTEAQRLAAEAVIAAAKGEKAGVLRRAFFGWPRLGAALFAVVGLAPTTRDAEACESTAGAPAIIQTESAAAREAESPTIYSSSTKLAQCWLGSLLTRLHRWASASSQGLAFSGC